MIAFIQKTSGRNTLTHMTHIFIYSWVAALRDQIELEQCAILSPTPMIKNRARQHDIDDRATQGTKQEILFFFVFSRATLVAYGGSLARGIIGAVAAGLRQSHCNAESELRLRPEPQLMATPDP